MTVWQSPIRWVAIAFLSWGVVAPASAELAAWDQKRVAEIAQQLAAACDAWEQVVRQEPGGQMGSGDAQEAFGVVQKAPVLREQSRTLAGHLASGKGYEQTRNLYRTLKEIVDVTEEEASRTELAEPTLDAWAKVTDLMRQIAPYYDAKASQE